MNTCVLSGTVTRDPRVVSLTVCVEEPSKTGATFTTYIGVECYGRSAAQAEALTPGALVAVEGRIGWKASTHKGEKRSPLVVLARQVRVRVLTPPGEPGP